MCKLSFFLLVTLKSLLKNQKFQNSFKEIKVVFAICMDLCVLFHKYFKLARYI